MDRRHAGPTGRIATDDDLVLLDIVCDGTDPAHEELADQIGCAVFSRSGALFGVLPANTHGRPEKAIAVKAAAKAHVNAKRSAQKSAQVAGGRALSRGIGAVVAPVAIHPPFVGADEIGDEPVPTPGPLFPSSVDEVANTESMSSTRAGV